MPNINADVFALVLEAVIRGTLTGGEPGLNLPLLLQAIQMAFELSMPTEGLTLAVPRYIAERCMFFNPWEPNQPPLDDDYFAHRSEDIYRAWLALQRFPRLSAIITSHDLYVLYVHTVPDDKWSGLVHDFEDRFFGEVVELARSLLPQGPAPTFVQLWARFQRATLRTNNVWFPHTGMTFDELFGPGPDHGD